MDITTALDIAVKAEVRLNESDQARPFVEVIGVDPEHAVDALKTLRQAWIDLTAKVEQLGRELDESEEYIEELRDTLEDYH